MFEGFSGVWTPVMAASRLKRGRTVSVEVAGTRVVFFRDARGKPVALLDRCPHRSVRLSLGKVTKDGCLECPFHGWRFGRDGKACEVPLNPDAKREQLFATPFPTHEAGQLIWLYTGAAASAPVVPQALTREDCAHTYLEVRWRVHWTRAMENMLDSPHVPYLHRKTIGRFVRPKLKDGSRMDVELEETAHGFRTRASVDGDFNGAGLLEFFRPNIMVLHIPIPGKVFRMHAICVPNNDQETTMIVIGSRSFMTWRGLNPVFNRSNRKIVKEDQAVVESSPAGAVPVPHRERSVRTDRATLQFRRYYLDELLFSHAAPPTKAA